jgi:GNAT superfamily N-acetyltransferase
MRIALKIQDIPEYRNIRRISKDDIPSLGSLMLNSYKGTIDYEGETLEDAISEIQTTLNGKYGTFLEDCSFLAENNENAISAIIITWFEEIRNPLLSFLITHPKYRNQGLGTYLLKKSINALMDNGYHELYLAVTDGNRPAQHLFKKVGFQEVRE